MIDDLLELGRIAADDAGTAEREPLADVVQRVVANLRPIAGVQHTEIEFDVSNGASMQVGSVPRLQQVVHCVASAAVLAAGADGRIRIAIAAEPEGSLVRFACSGANHRSPVGLGLALARSLAAAIDAVIDVTESDDAVFLVVSIAQPARP
jgi:K+-sensing histidine kinase KdpD